MLEVSGGLADPGYFRTLAEHAPATMAWLQSHGIEFITPIYYLAAGPPRIQPVGGGRAVVETLREAAAQAGVKFRYRCTASNLVMPDNRVEGIEACAPDGGTMLLEADAVILATGGFQGDCGDDAHAIRAAGRDPQADFAGHAFRYRRRHPDGAGAGRRHRRRLERHAYRAGRSAQHRLSGGGAGLSLRHRGRPERRSVFATKAQASSTKPGKFLRATSISTGRSSAPMRSSTAGCTTSTGTARAIRSEVPPFQAATLRDLAAQIGDSGPAPEGDRRRLQCRGDRRRGAVRRHPM